MVTGWPKPRVEWRREGVVTTKGSRKRGQRHTLMVSPGDFGLYSCHANNKLGGAAAETLIAVEPQEPLWISGAEGELPNAFTLQWETISLTPISAWEVQVGEEGNVESKSYKVENNKENAFRQNYPNNNNSSNSNNNNSNINNNKNNNNRGLRQRGIFKLDNLADSTAYWAALTTITQEGRTEHEKKFYFGTLGAEPRSDRITSSGTSVYPRCLSVSLLTVLLTALMHRPECSSLSTLGY